MICGFPPARIHEGSTGYERLWVWKGGYWVFGRGATVLGGIGGGLCESVLPLQGDLNCLWCVSPPGPAARAATCRACSPPEVVALNNGCVFAPHRAALQGQNVIAGAASPGGRPPHIEPQALNGRRIVTMDAMLQNISKSVAGCSLVHQHGKPHIGSIDSHEGTKPRRRKKSKSAGNPETFVVSCEIPWSCTDSGPLVWPARSRSTS